MSDPNVTDSPATPPVVACSDMVGHQRMKPKLTLTEWLTVAAIAAIAAIIFGTPGAWVVKSYFEAQSYNRLTGAHATTWDAMWVELRVQDSPKAQ